MATIKKPETKEVVITSSDEFLVLKGFLTMPEGAKSIVVFAHGSGSSRHSPRNKAVASVIAEAKIATLLMDLLMPDEEEVDLRTRHLRFDIGLLAQRLNFATEWLAEQQETQHLKVGYIGSSTGAAAALVAAGENQEVIKAVVSRGGRPDLAGDSLRLVKAPTLLIVGGDDFDVLELNQRSLEVLNCTKKLEIVPHATHLFEEPGTLEEASRLAKDWFAKYL